MYVIFLMYKISTTGIIPDLMALSVFEFDNWRVMHFFVEHVATLNFFAVLALAIHIHAHKCNSLNAPPHKHEAAKE